uniref:Uncharacterized protein n=1 Tax=Steinernema glaseri TaxID=37863 RepID=A0A1I7Y4L9_9BILA
MDRKSSKRPVESCVEDDPKSRCCLCIGRSPWNGRMKSSNRHHPGFERSLFPPTLPNRPLPSTASAS